MDAAGRRAPLNDTATLLIQLDGFKQGLEIPLAETVVAFALNDLEKDRANGVLGKYLQQDAALAVAVDENPTPLEFGHRFIVTRDAAVDAFIVGRRRLLKLHAETAQRIDGFINIVGAQRDMLDAFALVLVQVLLYLALIVLALVDGNANLAARRGERS